MSPELSPDLLARSEVHAALGDPVRLAIVEELATSDRSSSELAERFRLATNLLAHHLGVLERVGLVRRTTSAGDRRRRYVQLRRDRVPTVVPVRHAPAGRALFVCTHNSARSQLAAALWRARTGAAADSAGTHPADRIHPRAVEVARRSGLDLSDARPRTLRPGDLSADVVVTVCDRAHEELDGSAQWLHWSIPDPAEDGRARAFSAAFAELESRIDALVPPPAVHPPANGARR